MTAQTLFPHHRATERTAAQAEYAERQRARRAAVLAEYQPEDDDTPAADRAALQDAAQPCDLDALADAVRALLARRYSRRAVSAGDVRADAIARLPRLLADGHEPADAAALALHRADRAALSRLLRSKERAAGIGGSDDEADALALAMAAVTDDAGAEWLPVASTPRPDALRIVPPLSPEDAHALALDALPPRGRRVIAATLDANEGADPRATTHRPGCSKRHASPSGCCRSGVIAPALRTSVVAQAMEGSTSGPVRTRTKRDQQEYGTDYLQQTATARRARTEADRDAWTDHAERTRDALALHPHRVPFARQDVEPTPPPARRPLPVRLLSLPDEWTTEDARRFHADQADALDRLAKERPAGDARISTGTKERDLPEWAVMPDTSALPVRFVAPDPEATGSAARLAGSAGYDVAHVIGQEADAAARKERHAQGLAVGNDAARLARAAARRVDQDERATVGSNRAAGCLPACPACDAVPGWPSDAHKVNADQPAPTLHAQPAQDERE